MSNKFVQSNYTSQTATVYKTSIDDNFAVHNRVAGAFAPHAQDTPVMTIRLEAGFIPKTSAIATEIAAQNTATLSAPSSNPRKDIVYIDKTSGVIGVATGAEASSPSDPAVPTDKIAVARITFATSTSSITNSIIDDIRNLQLVGETATVIDLTPIRQDLAMLAIYNSVSDNRASYNLPFSFIDHFEDDTGTTTRTDVSNVSEYFSTISTSFSATAYATGDRTSTITVTDTFSTSGATGDSTKLVNGTSDTSAGNAWIPPVGATVSGKTIRFDYLAGNSVIVDEAKLYQPGNKLEFGVWTWQGADDASGPWTSIGSTFTFGQTSTTPQTQTTLNGNTTGYRYYQVLGSSGTTASDWLGEIDFKQAVGSVTASATGTLISDTQTSSVATTKMSGVILYKDNAGTATLGTHLKIYLSANGGSNWTEVVAADYGAVTPLFSTGVKMVRLAEQTVISGTTPVMKAVWASQASGTLETQLHGWAMNY